MGWGADVTHLLKAWQPHTHTIPATPQHMDVYSPCNHNRATGSWQRNRNLKINIYKCAKLHKTWLYWIQHLYGFLAGGAIIDLTKQKHLYAYFLSNFVSLKQFFHSRSLIQKMIWEVTCRIGCSMYPEAVQLPQSSLTIKAQAIKAPPQIKPTFIPRPCFLGHKLHSFGIWLLVAAVWWGK